MKSELPIRIATRLLVSPPAISSLCYHYTSEWNTLVLFEHSMTTLTPINEHRAQSIQEYPTLTILPPGMPTLQRSPHHLGLDEAVVDPRRPPKLAGFALLAMSFQTLGRFLLGTFLPSF
jgi:hypothetical protein